ncbi:hypothetical protein AK812_SmicGene15770 [Symbiodinium microadriaticum]|uniref:Transmembrane protein n=1 Tax=Symbiodinium microadriaticum TaxID=2951 RepID=A0A1Q9E250_SYMMI|nr:hypothetical protein AK812_SmicGene15770 [Symbiodinium microadriaticum]
MSRGSWPMTGWLPEAVLLLQGFSCRLLLAMAALQTSLREQLLRPAHLLLLWGSFLLSAAESSFSGVWYLVDVNSVVCPGSPGYAVINMTEPTAQTHSPHILTVFRTTNASVTLAFEITDATGKVITDQSAGVSLQQVARRLGEVTEDVENLWEEATVVQSALEEEAPPRQLSGRRRSYSGGYSSPRRRAVSSPRRRASSPSPPPSPPPPPASAGPVSGASARRRGYTEPMSQRRRTAGYDNKHYSNPSNPAAGSYGYASQSAAASNFGGRLPTSTPYGYTGANAYSGRTGMGSGMQIALAGGGGLLAGMALSNLMHHSWTGYSQQQMLSMPCSSGSWSGLCSTCVSLYGADKCDIKISPKIDATRDDLVNTGFIPADFTWPIHVKITSISSTDFEPSSICPPTTPGVNWTAPPMKQLFLTLTTMEELSAPPAASASSSGFSGMFSALIAALAACCCCCCCAAAAWQMSRKRTDWESGTSSESESDGYPAPGQMAYARPMQPPVPGQGPHPYWQGSAPQGPPQPAPYAGAAYATGAPYVATSFVQGSPQAYPAPFQSGEGFAWAGFGSGGFMDTAAPSGASWANVCRQHPVNVNGSTMMIDGAWGECLAWAVVYEHQNPGWESDPRFKDEGPAQQVINAMLETAPESMARSIEMGSQNLEEACHNAVRAGMPVPLINQLVR